MPDIDILREMVKTDAIVQLGGTAPLPSVILNEQDSDYYITIDGIPKNAIVIKADAFIAPKYIFKGDNGECKRADFVIITNEPYGKKNKRYILYVELKRTCGQRKDIIKQLHGAACFIQYCQAIGKAFWKELHFLDDYQPRFVSVKKISISKQKTRFQPRIDTPDTPEKMFMISGASKLQFNYLVQST